jgi:hypothetical protein
MTLPCGAAALRLTYDRCLNKKLSVLQVIADITPEAAGSSCFGYQPGGAIGCKRSTH